MLPVNIRVTEQPSTNLWWLEECSWETLQVRVGEEACLKPLQRRVESTFASRAGS